MDDTQDAAPSSTEPEAVSVSIESKASLEQAPIATAAIEDPNAGAPDASSAVETSIGASSASPVSSAETTSEDPNAATGAAALPAIVASALGASIPTGILGTVESLPAEVKKLESEAAGIIRLHLASIKDHLSFRGFEQSTVQFVHDAIAKIEKWL